MWEFRHMRKTCVASPPGQLFVKANEVAKIYNVTPATIFLWARQGKIPSVKFQETVRFDLAAVRATIEGGAA